MIRLFDVYMNDTARDNVAKVLTRDHEGRLNLTQGEAVDNFESHLKSYLGLDRLPVTTNSCTSALTLALHLAGVQEGDEVISTPMTCTATSAAIVSRGARIVWSDVDPATGLIDPTDVHRKMTPATKAIVAVDWAGTLPDYRLLKSYGCPVIEDAAHAFMAVRSGWSERDNCGDYVCWSFQAIKHLTTGDGGALLPPKGEDDRARLLRWYGLDRRNKKDFRAGQNVQEAGYKFNMNDLNAAIGLGNIQDIPEIVRMHRRNAWYYTERFENLNQRVDTPPFDSASSWWLYCLRVDNQAAFIEFMRERDIETGVVHGRNDRHNAYAFYSGRLPGVDAFASKEVAIPVGWWMTEEALGKVADAVIAYTNRGA